MTDALFVIKHKPHVINSDEFVSHLQHVRLNSDWAEYFNHSFSMQMYFSFKPQELHFAEWFFRTIIIFVSLGLYHYRINLNEKLEKETRCEVNNTDHIKFHV